MLLKYTYKRPTKHQGFLLSPLVKHTELKLKKKKINFSTYYQVKLSFNKGNFNVY